MAALPSPTQVAGTHSAIYEAYYHQVDPNGAGTIQALDAARFLKKSRLSDVVLSKIWDLSDPTGKGYLDKSGLFVALKLVALAQAGKDINMSNIHSETPPPKVGELPKVPPVVTAAPGRPAAPSPLPHASPAQLAPLSDWSMKPAERDKYSQLFDSLQPNNGLIGGNKVKGMLMESKLPIETLGKIWDLADQDKDGMLDRHEFMVAMHLVYKALEKHAVPTTLPPELRGPGPRPSRPPPPRPQPPPPQQVQSNASLLEGLLDLSSPTQTAPAMPTMPPVGLNSSVMSSISSGSTWVVTDAEKAAFDAQFTAADTDRDGFVSGNEIKHMFLDSGLPQATLAHIWALCDMSGVGKLSRGQFALAMWLVARALRGTAPPVQLTAEMVPPPGADAKVEPAVTLGPQPTPEMEAIAREVDALARERLALEAELAAKQRDLTVKTGEADSLQSELDTLTATLKQLENQKGEAQKRLNDLKTQVEKLRSQVSAQEAAAAETEAEVSARRLAAATLRERERALSADVARAEADAEHVTAQLRRTVLAVSQVSTSSHTRRRLAAATLRERERALSADVARAEADAEHVTAQLRRTVLAVSQANIKISHLEEQHRIISTAAEALAAPGTAGLQHLQVQPHFSAEHLERVVRGATPNDALEDEPFAKSNGFASGAGFEPDPFTGAYSAPAPAPAPAPAHDPFAPAHTPQPSQDGFATDPFASNADPFAGDTFTAQDNSAKENEDEADPFAVLHAPSRRSPTPALPPKRHKTPPPRPAPPRPNPPGKTDRPAMDFADDPFKDYRYEDPFNIEDPFADVPDGRKTEPFGRSTSVVGFETDDFFSASTTVNGSFTLPEKRSGRVSAPPVAYDPFSSRSDFKPPAKPAPPTNSNNNSGSEAWAAWPNDNWASDDAWAKPPAQKADAWTSDDTAKRNTNTNTGDWKTDNWANKSDYWAADFAGTDANKNLNETWPTASTLPSKKEKSPRPVKYAKSLVHTIGGIGRTKQKEKKAKALEAKSAEALPTEEQQWAWAAAESRRVQAEQDARRRREDAELQLALALSRRDQ